MPSDHREGSLEAPIRLPILWQNDEFYDQDACDKELARVFDICHGCRRCVNLCDAFPTLFDLIDESPTMELSDVPRTDYGKVVDQCYLCDLCYQTKCPYVPPHPWQVDFPHLMLRAKAIAFKKKKSSLRDKMLSATDTVGRFASMPVVNLLVNTANRKSFFRILLDKILHVHPKAPLPPYRRSKTVMEPSLVDPVDAGPTQGKVAIFATCYGQYNRPEIVDDLATILQHNGIIIKQFSSLRCCGMPKLELGDLETVAQNMEHNIQPMVEMIEEGYDIISPIPSCVLMFKQELPLMFPDHHGVQQVRKHIYDPFEYLMHRHKSGLLNTDFKQSLGHIVYQVACHQRVQNIGTKTRDVLSIVPDTQVEVIERCSGHDGTYAVKRETYEKAAKIVRPVVRMTREKKADRYTSDCPMAATHIAHHLGSDNLHPATPITLLRQAYGI